MDAMKYADEMKNMEVKMTYECGVCGKLHTTIAERIKCEQACLKRLENEEKAKKNAEYDARVDEVNKAFDYAFKLKEKLFEDYSVPYVYPRRKYDNSVMYALLNHFI